jgi:transcription antitermination protein NusB
MQARRIARELSLLSVSQIANNSDQLEDQQLQNVIMAAVRTLTTEVQEILENAAAEVKRGNDRLLTSETRAGDVQSARAMVKEALELAQTAINRLGSATELPELIQLTNQKEVRAYTCR